MSSWPNLAFSSSNDSDGPYCMATTGTHLFFPHCRSYEDFVFDKQNRYSLLGLRCETTEALEGYSRRSPEMGQARRRHVTFTDISRIGIAFMSFWYQIP